MHNSVPNAVVDTDRLWVGGTHVVTPAEPPRPGAAGRVFTLLYLGWHDADVLAADDHR